MHAASVECGILASMSLFYHIATCGEYLGKLNFEALKRDTEESLKIDLSFRHKHFESYIRLVEKHLRLGGKCHVEKTFNDSICSIHHF